MPSLLTILCERLNYEIWVPCSQCSPWNPRLHKHLYPLSVNPDWQMALCLHGEFFPQKFLNRRKRQNKTLSEEFITVQEQADKIFAPRLLKCTWQTFFICSIKSPQCTDMYRKEKFSIAIFLPRVLMYQKRQISLSVGYKTARSKRGHWEWLWRNFRTSNFAKNRFLSHFLIVR